MNAAELHRLARVLREVANAATADPGERPVSAGVLAVTEDIAAHDGTSVVEVARRTGLAQSLVSRTVADLVAHGVVASSPDPTDRRRSSLVIPPAVRRTLFRSRGARPIAGVLADRGLPAAKVEKLLDRLAAELL